MLADFFKKPDDATVTQGNITYPNAAKLLRPQSIKGPALILVGIIIVAAIAAGYTFASKAADALYFSEIRKGSQVEQYMAREIAYDMPQLKDYIAEEDAEAIYNTISEQHTLVLLSADGVTSTGFDAFRLPSDISPEEGTAALKDGIGAMDIVKASKVLNGGWRMTADFSSYQDLKLRYADMKSNSLEEAIIAAIHDQGFDSDESEVAKEGIDESGNTYKSGSIDIDGETYFWRVSAVKFNEAYPIKGMPETTLYVGIRMTN